MNKISVTEQFANSAIARSEQREIKTSFGKSPVWVYPASAKKLGSIVFVHGYRGTHEGVEPIVGALPEFDCYVPELPGFGHAEAMAVEHNLTNYSNWLDEFIKELKLSGDVTYFGHSFGTIILGKYIVNSSDKTRLALLNPVSAWPMRGPRKIMTKVSLVWYRLAARVPEGIGRWMLSHPIVIWLVTNMLYKGKDPVLKDWIHAQHKAHFSKFANAKMAEESFDASNAENMSEFSERIDQPVLLICADRDDITSIENQRKVAPTYKNATYVELLGTGHLPHYEHVATVAQHVREFVKINL
ncbi:MAG: alpha/beta fold hydrolase [Microbacteriaceae bacterium]